MGPLLGVVAALLATCDCRFYDRSGISFPAGSPQRDGGGLDAGVAGLALTLRPHLPPGPGNNALLSPLSIAIVLAALQMGARGPTARQISALLGQGSSSDQAYWAQLGSTLRAINASTEVTAQVASAIFVDASFALSPGYQQNVQRVLASDEIAADFHSSAYAAERAVNKWVSDATRGRIPQLVSGLDSSAVLIVANAVYFNGAWEKQFPLKDTRSASFNVNPSEAVPVDLMVNTWRVPYAYSSELRCKVLGIPYKGDAFAMFVVLPDEHGEEALVNFEAQLTPSSLLQLLASAQRDEDVIYMLPRITMDVSFSLTDALKASGATAMFDPFNADLSGLVAPGQANRLFVSEVVQRVRVDVTETGTEAAAATAAWVSRTSHPIFRADRPFLLYIQHLLSGTLLFSGRVVRPALVQPAAG